MPFSHLWLFYRNFILLTTAITFFQCVLMATATSWYFSITLFWTKLISSMLIGVLFHFFKHDHLYFFYNLGYSLRRLYTLVFSLDMLIWTLLITLTHQLL